MKLPSTSHPNPQIVTEASDWFAECRMGELAAKRASRFSAWLRRSPEHIQAYLEMVSAWNALPSSEAKGKIDVRQFLERARSEENVLSFDAPAPLRESSRAIRTPYPMAMAVAATAACILLGGAVWAFTQRGNYETAVGEQRSITLADGSSIELNADSRVKVRLSEQRRDVALERGEALFQVAKDTKRPFIVVSGSLQVRAVGTAFDINRKQHGTVVTVLDGTVAMGTSDKRETKGGVALSAGEQALVTSKTIASVRLADTSAAVAWRQKQLVFEDTSLEEVAEEFNRYNTRRLVVESPNLQAQTISGIYSSTDPASLIRFLRAQPKIQVRETDREIHITENRFKENSR